MSSCYITDPVEAEKIINRCEMCFVGMTMPDGAPYVLPMNFGYFDGHIVLHSGSEGTHIQHLERDNRVCITFCDGGKLRHQHENVACSYGMIAESVVCKGVVTFIDDPDEKIKYLNILMHKHTGRDFSYSAPAIHNVKVWLVTINEMTSKAVGKRK